MATESHVVSVLEVAKGGACGRCGIEPELEGSGCGRPVCDESTLDIVLSVLPAGLSGSGKWTILHVPPEWLLGLDESDRLRGKNLRVGEGRGVVGVDVVEHKHVVGRNRDVGIVEGSGHPLNREASDSVLLVVPVDLPEPRWTIEPNTVGWYSSESLGDIHPGEGDRDGSNALQGLLESVDTSTLLLEVPGRHDLGHHILGPAETSFGESLHGSLLGWSRCRGRTSLGALSDAFRCGGGSSLDKLFHNE